MEILARIWYTIPRKRRTTGKTTPTGHPVAEGRKSPSAVAAVAPRRHASVSSVHRWYPTSLEEGLKGLRPRPTPGRPPGLSEWQKKKRVKGLLRGLQRESGSPCICAFLRTTSRGWTSAVFSDFCFDIFAAPLSGWGIGERSIGGKKSSGSWGSIHEFIRNSFLRMRRNSIRPNSSGPRPTGTCPAASRRTLPGSTTACAVLHAASGGRRNSSGPASTPPTCPGHDSLFHYLCKTQ